MFFPCFVVQCFVSFLVFAIILMGKRALADLLFLLSWCLVTAVRLWLFRWSSVCNFCIFLITYFFSIFCRSSFSFVVAVEFFFRGRSTVFFRDVGQTQTQLTDRN